MKLIVSLTLILLCSGPALADFSLNPAEIHFGRVMLGFHETETVVIKNENSVETPFRFRALCDDDISYSAANCSRLVAPQKFCYFDINFSPIHEGTKYCRIRVKDSTGTEKEILVTGQGVVRP